MRAGEACRFGTGMAANARLVRARIELCARIIAWTEVEGGEHGLLERRAGVRPTAKVSGKRDDVHDAAPSSGLPEAIT